jgi:thiol-disulfide isomerase/thioredoxin
MKLRYFAILAAVLFCAACNQAKPYQIDGTFTTDDGAEVYLINLDVPDGGDTLSVTTVQGGKFAFTGKVEKPFYAYVGNAKRRVRMILEPGNAAVDLNEWTIAGTPMMDAVGAYNDTFYGFDHIRADKREALTARKAEMTPEEFNAEWDKLNAECKESKIALCDSIIRANKDNLVAAIVMNDLAMVDGEAFLNLYDVIAQPIREHSLVSKPYGTVKAASETAPGTMFKDYTIVGGNPDGTDVKLSDYVGKGKYILLDHWASWCGPCKKEMPFIKKAYEAFRGDKFDVVSIAVSDKREDTEAALAKLDMPWNQILDAQKIPAEIYGVNAIPHLILFAPDGTILRRDLRGEQIYSALEEILK